MRAWHTESLDASRSKPAALPSELDVVDHLLPHFRNIVKVDQALHGFDLLIFGQ